MEIYLVFYNSDISFIAPVAEVYIIGNAFGLQNIKDDFEYFFIKLETYKLVMST